MTREEKYSDDMILEMRQTKIKPIIAEFYELVDSLRPSKTVHLHEAVTYTQNHKKELLVFLEHLEVEMTNNLAERIVKPL